MSLLVQKFGGSSVASIAHINHIADIISDYKKKGHQLVVVVSAMQGETDRLIQLAHLLSESPDNREFSALVATGEQVSMALVAMALINRGIKAKSYTGMQAGIQTCSNFHKARIQAIHTKSILNDLENDCVVVVAGFQGVDEFGNITTLGRGGSDTTAVALAAALNAQECQIFTDVNGVYTTDPRMVDKARRLDEITFEEMLELSSTGAKVLQIRSVEFAGQYNVPLRVLSSSEKGPGTLIAYAKTTCRESFAITGISFSQDDVLVELEGCGLNESVNLDILHGLSVRNINIDMYMHQLHKKGKACMTFIIAKDDFKVAELYLNTVMTKTIQCNFRKHLSKVSIIGRGLKSHVDVIPNIFKVLSQHKVSIHLMATSEIKLSLIIDNHALEKTVNVLHDLFKLHETMQTIGQIGAN